MSSPMRNPMQEFDVFVKNIGEDAIELPEIGGYELDPEEEINMMSEDLPNGHYNDPQAVLRALNELTGTVLYQQRVLGNLTYRVVPRMGE
jgi:hypothetical protein